MFCAKKICLRDLFYSEQVLTVRNYSHWSSTPSMEAKKNAILETDIYAQVNHSWVGVV